MTQPTTAASSREEARSNTPEQQTANPRGLRGYGGGEEMPLAGYTALLGAYASGFAGLMLAAKKRDRNLPEKVDLKDVALLGVATHKLSRVIAKDWVTSPVRAPFTRYQGSAGAGEVKESSRGHGVRRAIGDLLTCPFCIGAWVAAAMGFGYSMAPRLTRLTGVIFAAEAISDFLHIGYSAARQRRDPGRPREPADESSGRGSRREDQECEVC